MFRDTRTFGQTRSGMGDAHALGHGLPRIRTLERFPVQISGHIWDVHAKNQSGAVSDMQHYLLLSRNLLYKGLTRTKQLAILVGSPKSIGFAVKRMVGRQRYTVLATCLKQAGRSSPPEKIGARA